MTTRVSTATTLVSFVDRDAMGFPRRLRSAENHADTLFMDVRNMTASFRRNARLGNGASSIWS